MLEFTCTKLDHLGSGNEGQDDIGWESRLDVRLYPECVGGVDEYTGVLGGDDRLDDGGEVVNIRKCFYAEKHVVKRGPRIVRGVLG